MTRTWRNLTVRTYALGVLLTLAVIGLDAAGRLVAIEHWFYDQRAIRFQRFAPPPGDRLVHLDIDDAALETIGAWPWPRTVLAEVVDELRLAGADALAFDVLMAEPQPPGVRTRPDGTAEPVDHDANLAAALGRFGRVMVPIAFSFDPRPPASPGRDALTKALRDDLELPIEQAAARAGAQEAGPVDESAFLAARREAMGLRLRDALTTGDPSADALRRLLLPNSEGRAGSASLLREFGAQLRRQQSMAEIARFALPMTRPAGQSLPRLIEATDELLMIPALARVASHSGYVDYLARPDDPVIRSIPLFVNHAGRLYPQMDLVLACAVAGVDVRDVRIEPGRVVVPKPGGGETVIPVRDVRAGSFGTVGPFMDIPWFGTGDWRTMYDYPSHRQTRQHVPMALPWALAESRKVIARNNAEADRALRPLAEIGVNAARAMLDRPPAGEDAAARLAAMEAVVREGTELAGPSLATPAAQLNDDERVFVEALAAVRRAVEENRAFALKSAELRALLATKAVLVSWTATGTIDHYPTPLHASCPGPVIHGVIFNAIVTGHFWRAAPPWVTWLITLGLGLLTTAVVVRLTPLRALVATLLLAGCYGAANAVLLFDYGDRIVGLAGPAIAVLLVWAALTLARLVIESRERARITRRFQSYVDPSLVDYVIAHPELARVQGEVREMTVVFTDLAGFTSLTENLRERAVGILGRYIGRMTPVIRRNRGLVHRFMGDGIMFSYGAPVANPRQASDAVATVLEMNDALAGLNAELAAEDLPRLAIRAGVCTGNAVVGDSGADDATEYACLGDTTNTAARLESANKAFGTRALLSARTVEQAAGQFLVRPIGRLVFVGKVEPVMTYEPLARTADATDEQRRLAALTTEMFDRYIAGEFEACAGAADALERAFGASKLAGVYRERCAEQLVKPDAAFAGLIVLREK